MTIILCLILIPFLILYMSRQSKKDKPSTLYNMILGLAYVDLDTLKENSFNKKELKEEKRHHKKQQRATKKLLYTHAALKEINRFIK